MEEVMRILAITITLLSASFTSLKGDTLHVPGQYPAIQMAVAAASPGDTVLVAPGTYVENILFMGKAVTVKSAEGPRFTVIDGGHPQDPDYGSGVAFCHGEGPDSVIDGFTVTNGTGTLWNNCGLAGGGIFCDNDTAPVIRNNIIINNSTVNAGGGGGGGGIASLWNSRSLIENNIVAHNYVLDSEGAGGIGCGVGSQMTLRNNLVYANVVEDSPNPKDGPGGRDDDQSAFSLMPCSGQGADGGARFSGLGGGVVCGDGTTTLLVNQTIYGNYAKAGGGGLISGQYSDTTIINTIIWNNDAPVGHEILLGSEPLKPSTLTISYSDVQGGQAEVDIMPYGVLNWNAGMLDEDPLFTSPAFELFNLRQPPCQPGAFSPCVDSGDPASTGDGSTRTDGVADSGIRDMGYHYPLFTMPGGTALQVDVHVVQASAGGALHFDLNAGGSYANRPWGVFAGVTGCYPGTELPDGTVLPLNFDIVTTILLGVGLPGFGTLDGLGTDVLDLYVPPVALTTDIMLYFAFACPYTAPDGWFASNAVSVLLDVP
jgi:hypothetical protein